MKVNRQTLAQQFQAVLLSLPLMAVLQALVLALMFLRAQQRSAIPLLPLNRQEKIFAAAASQARQLLRFRLLTK